MGLDNTDCRATNHGKDDRRRDEVTSSTLKRPLRPSQDRSVRIAPEMLKPGVPHTGTPSRKEILAGFVIAFPSISSPVRGPLLHMGPELEISDHSKTLLVTDRRSGTALRLDLVPRGPRHFRRNTAWDPIRSNTPSGSCDTCLRSVGALDTLRWS